MMLLSKMIEGAVLARAIFIAAFQEHD